MGENRRVKARLILGLVALLAGIGLMAFAFVERGPPWGFRDRAGVILETVGAVELTAGPKHRGAKAGATMQGKDARGLFLGDELRTGPLSLAKIKTPDISFQLGGGSQLKLDPDGGLTLARGSLTLDVPRSEKVFRIRGGGGEVAFEEGAFDLVADGRAGNLFVLVRRGKATAVGEGNNLPLSSGNLLRLSGGKAEVSEPATDVDLRVTCRLGEGEGTSKPRIVTGQAPLGTLLLIEGRLLYPKTDKSFSAKLPPDDKDVIVFARSPGGAAKERTLTCR